MRRIKNYKKLSKKGLRFLLKSKRSLAELFNNNPDNDKISEIKKILNKLRDILTKEYRKKIKKKLCEIENKKNLSKAEEEEISEYLIELKRILNKKEKYRYHDCDDPDYYGIRDIDVLLGDADEKDYYKPILVKSSFKGNCKIYDSRGDRNKDLSVKQYIDMIIPYLRDMINDHKTSKTRYGEWKIQISMRVNFISSKDTGETRTFYVLSDNEKIMWGNETDNIIK